MNPWHVACIINAIIWSLVSTYVVYATAMLVIAFEVKVFVLAILAWIAVTMAEIVFAGMAE